MQSRAQKPRLCRTGTHLRLFMFRSNLSLLFKFLVGILLIQSTAALLVYAALKSDHIEVWLLLGALAVVISFFAAFWFASIAGHFRKDALARVRESFSREREQIRVKAEREKTKVIKQSHQEIAKERSRAQNKANFKVGASVATAVGLGALMVLTQFVTIGLLTLTTAGGALGGYLFRARQDRSERLGAEPKRLGALAGWPKRPALLRKTEAPASGSPASPDSGGSPA